jgi:hypothetical protein
MSDDDDKDKNLIKTEKKDIFSFDSGNMLENMKMAEMLANSSLVPKDYRGQPGNVIVAIQMGQEIGLKPMQAIQGIAVINGRPCIWGDALIGLVRKSELCEYVKETFNGELMIATCESKRAFESEPHITSFSLSDAQAAGLTKKPGPWQQYRKRMLQMRARGFNLRDNFADVLKGLSLAEEMQDVESLKQINDAPATKSAKASKVASFINEQIEDAEIQEPENVDRSTGEVINYSEQISECKSIEELVKLKTLLVQIPEGKYSSQLQTEYNAKGRELYLEGANS